jgi:hypothetical protein
LERHLVFLGFLGFPEDLGFQLLQLVLVAQQVQQVLVDQQALVALALLVLLEVLEVQLKQNLHFEYLSLVYQYLYFPLFKYRFHYV